MMDFLSWKDVLWLLDERLQTKYKIDVGNDKYDGWNEALDYVRLVIGDTIQNQWSENNILP